MLWNEETEGRDRVCFTHRLKRCCTRSCSTFELLCFHLDSTQQKWQLRNTQPCSRVCTLTVCWYQTEMQTESPNTCFSCTNRRATLCLNKSVKTQTQSLPHRRAHFLSLKETNIILFLHAHAHTQKKKKVTPSVKQSQRFCLTKLPFILRKRPVCLKAMLSGTFTF